jgi:transcription antitermination protein NusB
MSKLQHARELGLKILFQVEVGKLPADEALETAFEEVQPAMPDRRYVQEMVTGVLAHEGELDAIIGDLAEGWRLERLAKVDKNVLRIALYELIHKPELSPNAVINDAVEMAKKYSTEDSGRFVNGILGTFLRRQQQETSVDGENRSEGSKT